MFFVAMPQHEAKLAAILISRKNESCRNLNVCTGIFLRVRQIPQYAYPISFDNLIRSEMKRCWEEIEKKFGEKKPVKIQLNLPHIQSR